MLFKIVPVLWILAAVIVAEEVGDTHTVDCASKDSPGAMGECFSQQYKNGKIGDLAYQNGLFLAMQKLESPSTYYSGGVEWGSKYSITFGTQKHYHFDSRVTLDLRIPYWGSSAQKAVGPWKSGHVYYAHTANSDLREVKTITDPEGMESGDDVLFNIYFEDGWADTMEVEDCDGLEKSAMHRAASKLKNVVLVVSKKHKCQNKTIEVKIREEKDTQTRFEYLALEGNFQ